MLETIRQIMAARAIHNVFKMTESHLVVSSEAMRWVTAALFLMKSDWLNTVRQTYIICEINYANLASFYLIAA